MSADGSVTLTWAGEERKFRLAIGQLRELQENINRPRVAIGAQPIGPRTLARILSEGDAWPDEIREVIRLGLIGGGMKIESVPALVRRYVDERPLLESAETALAVLLVAITPPPDDSVGKNPEAEMTATETATTDSSSPHTTGSDAPLDLVQDKSMNSPSGNFRPASTDSIAQTERTKSPRP